MSGRPLRSLAAILLGTLIVGVLDIGEVLLFYLLRGGKPLRVLQAIAGGILGREAAFRGGVATAFLGLLLHFFIAFVVVAIYILASSRFPLLIQRPLLFGALYGIAVNLVMSHIVVPLSALGSPPTPPPWPVTLNLYFAHIFCVGIPAALVARWAHTRPLPIPDKVNAV